MITDAAGNNVRSVVNDVSYGLHLQPIVIDSLAKYFDEAIEETSDKYARYDAYSNTTLYEIKCRRCSIHKYNTTIIPIHKAKSITQRLLFVFKFNEGLFYIEYNLGLFQTFESKEITVYRLGSCPKPVIHYLIPTHLLIKIDI